MQPRCTAGRNSDARGVVRGLLLVVEIALGGELQRLGSDAELTPISTPATRPQDEARTSGPPLATERSWVVEAVDDLEAVPLERLVHSWTLGRDDKPSVAVGEFAPAAHEGREDGIGHVVGFSEVDDDRRDPRESKAEQPPPKRKRRAESGVGPDHQDEGALVDLEFGEHGAERPFPCRPWMSDLAGRRAHVEHARSAQAVDHPWPTAAGVGNYGPGPQARAVCIAAPATLGRRSNRPFPPFLHQSFAEVARGAAYHKEKRLAGEQVNVVSGAAVDEQCARSAGLGRVRE